MNLERDDLEDDEATSDQASVCQNEEDVEGHAEDVTLPDLPQEDGTTERDLNHAESRAAELTEELDIMDLEQFHLEWPEELDDDSPVSDATSEPHARVLHSPTAALAHHSTEVEPVYLSSLSHPPDLDTTSPPLDRSHHTDQLETIGAASLLLPRSRDSTSKSGRQSSPPVVQPKSRSARLACLADVLSDLGFDSDALLNALSCTEDEWDPVNKMVIKRGRFADWIHLKKRLRARAAKVSSHSSRNIDEDVNAKPPPRGVVESFVNTLSSSDRHAYLVAMFSDLGFDAEDVLDDLCGMEEEWAVIKENIIRLGGQFAFADWVLVKWGLRTRAARLQATASDS
ncbi:hypothetical protein SCP_0101200 [Sparassis crispa]|uniref:Uncharacterized protein n=1 Tax=Sparassis crispa TaxID=139825 RepID=A0A401G505_9APHY|nr:hypothetical protein SCP_0101200 [Sparassis crispa]GBE77247.1 hypothetical protein SCP_0101200 [Sparassis crispa]